MEDAKGKLWLSTNSSGSIQFDSETGQTISFNTASGLNTNSIVATLEDKSGNIWMSSNKGLSVLDVNSKRISHFTKSDGLHGNQFNNNAALWHIPSGTMLFGGIEGFTAFHPEQIQVNTFNPPILFTHFKLNNQDVEINPDSPLQRNITLTTQIDLKHFQNSFSIEFAALQYDRAQRNQYSYKLENFSDKWIDLGTERKTTFTGLPPGDYQLLVRATNNNNEFMDQTATLRIVIHPAWWQTIWSKLLLLLTLILVGYVSYQARVGYLKRQRNILRMQVQEATQEIESKNKELVVKVSEISDQNLLLKQQQEELHERDREILTQNEELMAQNEQISVHRQKLEDAHAKLKELNNQLEELVAQRTAKLELTVRELDTVVAELDRFVYSASHDLSAPLKSVLGLVNIMRAEKDPTLLPIYYDYIERSIEKLENVIRSLVEFSRNTHYPVAKIEFNLHNVVAEVIEELAFWPEARVVTISNHVSADFPVHSDPDRLKVIPHNLISNSIKYSDPTKEKPQTWIESEYVNGAFVFRVRDNGIGIEEAKQAHVL